MAQTNRRTAAKARTREKVLQGAKDIWAKPGTYDAPGSTVRDLAKSISMSTGAIFANFDNKAALWEAAFGTPPPIDSALTRAAPGMLSAIEAAIPLLKQSGHSVSADLMAEIAAAARTPAPDLCGAAG